MWAIERTVQQILEDDYATDDAVPFNVWSNAAEASHVVKSGQAALYGLTVYNSNASAQFILLFDSQVLPADGAVATTVFRVAGLSDKEVEWVVPRIFQRGIVICNSSTQPTKTIGAADCTFDVQFI